MIVRVAIIIWFWFCDDDQRWSVFLSDGDNVEVVRVDVSKLNIFKSIVVWIELLVGLCYVVTVLVAWSFSQDTIAGLFSIIINDSLLPPIWCCKNGAWQTIGFGVWLAPLNFYIQATTDDEVRKLGKICVHISAMTNDRRPSVNQVPRTFKRTTVVGQSKVWTPY